VRDKIANLAAPYRPETWDWMNDRLNAEEPTADPLDEAIRNKMTDLSIPYHAESWDQMSGRLDEIDEGSPAGAEMQSMDEAIYERMHRLEKPYDPNHWPMLLKKLEGNAYVGEHIIRYKAMELSLLLLLLITFIRLPFQSEDPQPLPQVQQTRPQAQHEINSAEDNVLDQAAVADASGSSLDAADAANTEAIASGTGSLSSEATGGAIAEINKNSSYTDPLSDALIAEEGGRENSAPERIEDMPNLPSETRQLPAVTEQSIAAEFFTRQHKAGAEHTVLGVNPSSVLGMMTYLPTGMARPLCLTCSGKLDQEAKMAKQETFIRIGMQGGPDYNRVITPSTEVNGTSYQADRYSLGYSGGLTIGLEKGRWEIETGLMYSNKRYYSLPILVLDGSVEDGFFGDGTKQFDLDVFQVPLNFRYNFFRKDRWRIYAMGGMSLHVTTQSNYYLAEADGFATGSFRPQPTRPGEDNSGRNAPSIKSEFDNFTKGWLEGGAFSKNSYLTGNVGFGIERFLTDYWSIYAQPTYSHSLIYLNNGLGPYYDRIHTNSLIFGFKVRLK
jgi:hypothetical protein